MKFSWFFLFSGYPVLCVCEMMKLLLVSDTLSYLNLRNDKRNSSPLGWRSHKVVVHFYGCVVNSWLSYLHISSLKFRGLELLLVGPKELCGWSKRKSNKPFICMIKIFDYISAGIRKVTLLVWTIYRRWLRKLKGEDIFKFIHSLMYYLQLALLKVVFERFTAWITWIHSFNGSNLFRTQL